MATGIRLNAAKNFAGQLYATQDWVNSQISASEFFSSISALANNSVTFTRGNGQTATLDLSGLVTAGANGGISVTNNAVSIALASTGETATYLSLTANGLQLNGIGSAIDQKINAVVGTDDVTNGTLRKRIKDVEDSIDQMVQEALGVEAGTGITITAKDGAASTQIISTNLKLVKKTTANTGYAASYMLTDGNGTAISGSADIDVVKDQFLKSASVVWSTDAATMTGESATKSGSAIYPFIKMEMYTNDNGVSSDDTAVTPIYIPVNSLFSDYTAGNGIAIADQVISVALDSASGKVRVAAGDAGLVDVVSVGANGLKISNIQAAIDYAVAAVAANLGTEVDAASAAEQVLYGNDVALNNAIQAVLTLTEANVPLTAGKHGVFTVAISNGVVTITSDAGAVAGAHKVLAVYDANGNEIRPDLTYNKSTKTATLVADFGATALDGSWDITYTVAATGATVTQPTDR